MIKFYFINFNLISIASFIYNNFFQHLTSLTSIETSQSTTHVKPLLPADPASYQILKEKMDALKDKERKDSTFLYVTDKTGKHPEKLLSILGFS